MTFEDFLEALVRLSTMMAFPTKIEIEALNARNAGEYLLALQADNPLAYTEFLETHRPRHQDADGSDFDAEGTGLGAFFQPVWLTIQHLVDLLIYTVERNTSALTKESVADGAVDADEAANFIRRRSTGKALSVQSGKLAGADWRMAQDKAMFTAAAIKIQLASRAKKARRKVEERRLRNEEVQREQALEDVSTALEGYTDATGQQGQADE